ncbi:hypothetical protein ACOTTU_17020 [Roseobacter sp. EG26]|uniref:hypothetical protein n=1 Tax=Roseobacter sp. EG26 TaxID=3412477 RepID=UPI003CE5A3A1
MKKSSKNGRDDTRPLKRVPKKVGLPYDQRLLILGPLISALLAALAIPDLIGAETAFDYVKAILIAISAGCIAYGINRLAIERGAMHTAIGTPMAGIVSLGSILVVGIGLYAATFGGLVKDATDILRYEQFAQKMSVYVDDNVRSAQTSAQVMPVIGAIVSDLSAKEACERDSGCLGPSNVGGTGPTYRAVSGKRQQAEAISAAVLELQKTRNTAAARLAGLLSEMHSIIGNDDLSGAEQREQLQDVAAEIGQTISRLKEAVPTALIASYAEDLRQGVLVPRNEEASQNLTDILRGHARTLSAVLNAAETQAGTPPAFPAKTGISDTFSYILFFLPLALIILVVELVFPSVLFCYTVFAFKQRVTREED